MSADIAPDQKTALITGASSGIGEAIARRFAAEGYRVLSAQRRPAPVGESLIADLLQPGAAQAVMAQVSARTDRLDVLVNNAGLMLEGTAEESSEADWQAQMDLNLSLPFLLIREALPLLRQERRRRYRQHRQHRGACGSTPAIPPTRRPRPDCTA